MRFNTITLLLLGTTLSMAQDVRISGNLTTNTPVFQVTNTSTAYYDRPAVNGISQVYGTYGVGVKGDGAWIGVYGNGAGPASPSMRIGTAGIASGAAQNFGLYGYAPAQSGSYSAYLSGNMLIYGTITYMSDSRLKTNITDMPSSLDKVMSLKPKNYQMVASANGIAKNSLPQGTQDGLIAQDVQAVFPELVSDVTVVDPAAISKTNSLKKDAAATATAAPTTYKGVNYMGLVPVLIKALQEQQAQINTLQQQINRLKSSGN